MLKKLVPAALWVSVAAAATVSTTTQAADVKAQIKHREATMEAIAGHFTAIMSTMKDPGEFAQDYQFHAESIARLSRIAAKTFPEGSDKGKTHAKSEIWDNPEKFKEAMETFQTRADAFADASKGDDPKAFAMAAKNLGGSCKGCHDDFKDD